MVQHLADRGTHVMSGRMESVAVRAGVTGVTALALAAAWSWAGIEPESSWPGIALLAILVALLPSIAGGIELRRSNNLLAAAGITAAAVALAGAYEVWAQWAAMSYDRGAGSALAQATLYLAAVAVLASAGFALVVLVSWLIRRNGHPAAA